MLTIKLEITYTHVYRSDGRFLHCKHNNNGGTIVFVQFKNNKNNNKKEIEIGSGIILNLEFDFDRVSIVFTFELMFAFAFELIQSEGPANSMIWNET